MILLFCLLPIVLVFRILNYSRIDNETLNVRNKLEALEQRLTLLVIDDKIERSNPFYDHLAFTITKLEGHLVKNNFWIILYTTFVNRKVEEPYVKQILDFEQELGKWPELKSIYNEYVSISVNYFLRKSIFSIIVTGLVMAATKHVSMKFNRWIVSIRETIKYHVLTMQEATVKMMC